MKKEAILYTMRAITNMHVGSGDNNYGVVDKLVQRDSVSGVPCIHSSSLKGAMREFFEYPLTKVDYQKAYDYLKCDMVQKQQQAAERKLKDEDIKFWNENDTKIRFVAEVFEGIAPELQYDFFGADLVSIPVRSNAVPYFNAVSPGLLKEVIDKNISLNAGKDLSCFDCITKIEVEDGKPIVLDPRYTDAIIEEHEWKAIKHNEKIDHPTVAKALGNNIVLLSVKDFKQICSELPVIARNSLENGQSQNLWYEEVVPRESRFMFTVMQAESTENKTHFDSLKNKDTQLQIGANASIGYGFTKIDSM